MKKLVLTGAAGRLGSYLREPLSRLADSFVSSDIVPDIGKLHANETYVMADLADLSRMQSLLQDADMVVHFGAIGDEAPFDEILGPNIIGAYNIWQAAHVCGVKRVVYASSIHVVGMHARQDFIGIDAAHRPDTFYGLAKCFAEDLGRMYWDKYGLECVCLRILSCAPVSNTRALGTWLSYGDLIHLVSRAIDTPTVGFSVVYGVSNNDRVPVDNSKASFLGYRPRDNAEEFAQAILAANPPANPTDGAHMCHGGPFATTPLGQSAIAALNIVQDKKTL